MIIRERKERSLVLPRRTNKQIIGYTISRPSRARPERLTRSPPDLNTGFKCLSGSLLPTANIQAWELGK